MSKIKELLEKTNIRERADDIWAFQKEGNLSYDQREAIKKYSCLLHDAAKIIDQALALLKQQPPAGEFTKEIRRRLNEIGRMRQLRPIEKSFLELCDRLDTSEASKAELLELCEESRRRIGGKMNEGDTRENPAMAVFRKEHNVYIDKLEAVIAKAKKE